MPGICASAGIWMAIAMENASTPRGISRFLLIRLAYYLTAFVLSLIAGKAITTFVLAGKLPHTYEALVRNGLVVIFVLASYALLVRIVEKRPATEVRVAPLAAQFVLGAAIGIALIALACVLLWARGIVSFGAGLGVHDLLRAIAYPAVIALLEEMLFR